MQDNFTVRDTQEAIEVEFTYVGEPGKTFKFEDFTPEELESLRGPQGLNGTIGFVDFEVNDDLELIIINESAANFHVEDGELLIDINL